MNKLLRKLTSFRQHVFFVYEVFKCRLLLWKLGYSESTTNGLIYRLIYIPLAIVHLVTFCDIFNIIQI